MYEEVNDVNMTYSETELGRVLESNFTLLTRAGQNYECLVLVMVGLISQSETPV